MIVTIKIQELVDNVEDKHLLVDLQDGIAWDHSSTKYEINSTDL